MNKIELAPDVDAICKKLGVDPKNVLSITLTPGKAEVTEFLLNERGDAYIVDDERAATETRTYTIT